MRRVKEAIVVEGRYDKNALSQVVDAVILETSGFGVFRNDQLVALLRRLADRQGLIVLTDSDGAGFVIRNFLKGALPQGVKHAYIPDVYGKERRKRVGGKEGKLGVEGMRPQVLLQALERAGATFLDGDGTQAGGTAGGEGTSSRALTKADLYVLGLTGAPDSAARRQALLRRLELPEHLSTNALLDVLSALYDPEELRGLLEGGDD